MTSIVDEQCDESDRRGYQAWTSKLADGMFKSVVSKLFTNEDNKQFHKTFGILSLISFLYRYCYVYPTTGTLGFDGRLIDHVSIMIHIILSTSSLLFHVIAKRVISRPMIIWEEYRLHAIVFSLRCLSVYMLGFFQPFANTNVNIQYVFNAMVVLLHHVVADEITKRYGSVDKSQTTVRIKDDSSVAITFILRFYAFYQFAALSSHLTPNARLMDLGFNALIAIQSSAFLMTLYRKSLISYKSHGLYYTLCLVISISHIFRIQWLNSLFIVKLLSVYFLRVRYGISKYSLWSIFTLVSLPLVEKVLNEKYMTHISPDGHTLEADFVPITIISVTTMFVLFVITHIIRFIQSMTLTKSGGEVVEYFGNIFRTEFQKIFPHMLTTREPQVDKDDLKAGLIKQKKM